MNNTQLTKIEIMTLIDSLMEYDGRDNDSLDENVISPLIEKLTNQLIQANWWTLNKISTLKQNRH